MFLALSSSRKPVLYKVVPGRFGKDGASWVTIIGSVFYPMQKKCKGQKWTSLRCKEHQGPSKCGYTVRVRNLGGLTINDPGYFSKYNWEIIENLKEKSHVCQGVSPENLRLMQRKERRLTTDFQAIKQ